MRVQPPPRRLEALLADIRAAQDLRSRRVLAKELNSRLLALGASGTRQGADSLQRLLESGALSGLVDPDGRTCRAIAVEALLSMGFPIALEVAPEDLEHYRRALSPPGATPSALAAVLLVVGAAWLHTVELLFGAARAAAGEALLAHLALPHALIAALAAGLAAASSRALARRRYRAALVLLTGLGLALAPAYPPLLWTGAAALGAWALLGRR